MFERRGMRFRRRILTAMLLLAVTILPAEMGHPSTRAESLGEAHTLQFPVVLRNRTGSLYEKLFSIPVGEDGIQYDSITTTPWGPCGLTMTPEGDFIVGDSAAHRLLRYCPAGVLSQVVDLEWLNVTYIMDVVARNDDILVLEHTPQIVRRVHVFTGAGMLRAQYDIPSVAHIPDFDHTLSGIAMGGQGEVLVEYGGGGYIYRLVDADGLLDFRRLDGYPYNGQIYALDDPGGGFVYLHAGAVTVGTQLTDSSGGLSLLGVSPDGTLYVERTDVGASSVIQVDVTVHPMDGPGNQLGVTRFPLSEQKVYVPHPIVVAPDGSVYAMITRWNVVDIVRLRLVPWLEPRNSTFVEPVVERMEIAD